MTLFIINKSPFLHAETGAALELVSEGDAIILIHDAVFALKHKLDGFWTALESLAGKNIKLYALEEDCEARGIVSDDAIVNYDGFVDLRSHRFGGKDPAVGGRAEFIRPRLKKVF